MRGLSKGIKNKLEEDHKKLIDFVQDWKKKGKPELTICNISCGLYNYDCEHCGITKI